MQILIASLLLVLTVAQVRANELQLVVNGKAIHHSNKNLHAKNYGLGYEYELAPREHWLPFVNGSFLKDSLVTTSNYLVGGIKPRFELRDDPNGWHADVGFFGYLLTRKDYDDDHLFSGILPVLSVGKQWFAVNATYIPKMSLNHVNLFFFQLKFRLAEF